jgi:class 3 adenylate cyclase/tetratricopeptide (TPR) repeat protein
VAERALERRIVTVLFCDVVGFTSLSEALDAEDVVAVQDAYFGAVRETVARHGGALEKFIGDAAVAVFGVPRVRDDDAVRAVRAALAVAAAVDQLGARLGLAEGELRLRVGVNTGEVVYGEATAERGPVTGDTVNMAARLQTAAPPGGVLVGEQTALAVEGAIVLEPAGELELKGKAAPTRAWLAAAEEPEPSRERAMRGIRAPMLGRDAELRRLRALAEPAPGEVRRAHVVAPPGVGKTRLVDELGAAVDGVVLRARLRPDVLSPYDGVAQLLASALAGAEPRERLLELLAGPRAAVVADAAAGLLAPGERAAFADRDAAFEAWLEALDALADGRRSMWIVEDVHWASGDLVAFLDHAGGPPAANGRLVLTTARPVARDRLPAAEIVDLEPLSPASTAELVGALVGDALPTELVERIAQVAGGNALFVEELLRSWIGSGGLVAGDAGWHLRDDPAEIAVPSTVQTIYAAQLDDLPAGPRQVVRRASVPGRRFPSGALEPLGVDDADESLHVLERRALVAGPDPDPVFGSIYAYRHALLRDAGYASLARAERADLHVRLARWLEGLGGALAEVIGRHYAAAVESAPRLAQEIAPGVSREEAASAAAHWFEAGAQTAHELAAHETAAVLLERSLELGAADGIDAARRRRLLGEVLAEGGDMDEARAQLEQARELVAPLIAEAEGRREYTLATAALGRVANQQVRFAEAERLADDALALLGERDDAETAQLLLLRAMGDSMGTDAIEQPQRDTDRAIELAARAGDADLELDARMFRAGIELDFRRSAEDLAAVWSLARERGRWLTAASARRMEASILLDGDRAAAARALEDAGELCVAHGLRESLAWTEYLWVEYHLLAGAWDEAIAAARRAHDIAEPNAYTRAAIRTWYAVLPAADAAGNEELVRSAHAFSEEARAFFPEVPAPWARVMSTAADLRFAAAGLPPTVRYTKDDDAALPAFEESSFLPSFLEAADVLFAYWAAEGEAARAAEAVARTRRAAARYPMQPVADGVFTYFAARLGKASADEAVEKLRTAGSPSWLERARALRG